MSGANFEGVYQYAKGAAKKIREYAPQDKELHRIADALQDVQRRHLYRLTASVLPKSRDFCMDVHVEDREHPCNDIGSAESEVRELMQDFAHWIYKQLENEYEYQISDEAVEDTIRANEYEFTENGERA